LIRKGGKRESISEKGREPTKGGPGENKKRNHGWDERGHRGRTKKTSSLKGPTKKKANHRLIKKVIEKGLEKQR